MELVTTYYPPGWCPQASSTTDNQSPVVSVPVDAMKLLVLAATIKKVSPNYGLLCENCYFFMDMAVKLMIAEFGGEKVLENHTNKLGKVAGMYTLNSKVASTELQVKEAREQHFPVDWRAFEDKVCRLIF